MNQKILTFSELFFFCPCGNVLKVDRLYIIAQVSLGPFMTARFLEFQTAAYALLTLRLEGLSARFNCHVHVAGIKTVCS